MGAALWRHTRVSRLGARAFEISKAKENLMAAFGNMLLANGKAMASTRRTGRPSRRAATGVSDAINAAKDCDDQVNKAERDEAERRRNAAQWRAAAQRRAASARSSTAPPAAPPAARRRQRQPRQQGQHDEAPAVAVVARSEDSIGLEDPGNEAAAKRARVDIESDGARAPDGRRRRPCGTNSAPSAQFLRNQETARNSDAYQVCRACGFYYKGLQGVLIHQRKAALAARKRALADATRAGYTVKSGCAVS